MNALPKPRNRTACLVAIVLCGWSTNGNAEGCPGGRENAIVVHAGTHLLSLCEASHAVRSFNVRIGHHGIGKIREGDGKTPTGDYSLGVPRPSRKYGIFIPIGYPTAAQSSKGYTGGAVGVHGPHRLLKWLRRAVNWFDTTDGCIGLATDEEMAEVANWVSHHPNVRITVE